MAEEEDWNAKIIEEFRANDGKVGGPFEGATLLLLHAKGARTGLERVKPLGYQKLADGSLAVFGSKAGAPTNPDWFYNVRANPEAEIELGPDTVPVTARVAPKAERDEIWERQKKNVPQFAEYEKMTTREIPVVVLEKR